MSVTEVELAKFRHLIPQNSYIKLYEEIAAEVQKQKKENRSTIAQRSEAWKQVLATMDEEKLLVMQEKMSEYVDLVSKIDLDINTPPKSLDDNQRVHLMKVYLMYKEMSEFLEVCKQWFKDITFSVIEAEKEAAGVEDFEHAGGEILVPELGKRFCKEGGKRKNPTLDEDKLKELLGDKWEDACEVEEVPEVVIPAHREVTFSIEKLMELAESDLTILETVREALIPGDWGSNSFTVRNT